MNTFGEFLFSLRKEKGMTQAELAEKLGVSNKAVSNGRRMKQCPKQDFWCRFRAYSALP